jgi:hypothetical protein
MPTKINRSKSDLVSGILLLVVFPLLACYFTYDLVSTSAKPFFFNRTIRDCIIILFALIAVVRYAVLRYSTPYQVIVDDELKTFELKYFFRAPQIVRRDHMVSYNPTIIKVSGRSGTTYYSGVYLNMLDGAKVLFSEQSLEDCSYIQSMLDYWGVKKLESLEE